jgi:transposase
MRLVKCSSRAYPVKEIATLSSPAPVSKIQKRKRVREMPQRRKKSRKIKSLKGLPEHLHHININAAGIDVGSDRHVVAVPEGRDAVSVREFGTFTADLQAIGDWLEKCGVTTVAMESTGVYWIPLFEVLEQRGIEVKLVDARHVKNVSGRKSDVLDSQWIQQLHTYGLLAGAYRPPDEICTLRG